MADSKRITVLLSGRGSNLQNLLEHQGPYQITTAISNRPEAAGLNFAREAGAAAMSFGRSSYPSLAEQKRAIYDCVRDSSPDLVVLAGYMQILTNEFVEEWYGKILNIHPSLLPKFPGLDTHQRALDAGEQEHGCSVHYVDSGVDTGPVIAQARTKIVPGETAEDLAARVLKLEHQLFPWVVAEVAKGNILLDGRTVWLSDSCRDVAATNDFVIP